MINYFLKIDETFIGIGIKFAKALINKSYINDKTCGSPALNRKGKYHTYWILHLPMLPTTIKKGFHGKI